MLTPLVVDPAHPFPYISGLSLSLAVMITEPDTGLTMFARVKVPPLLPRFLTVSKYRFVPLEDVIAAHLHRAVHRAGDPRTPRVPGHPGPGAGGG